MKRIILLLGLLVLFSGCATAIPKLNKPVENSRTFEASYEKLWNTILQAMTNSGETIAIAQKDSGLVTFQRKIPLNVKLETIALAPKGVLVLANHWVIVFPVAHINVVVLKSDDKRMLVTINAKIVGDFGKPWTTFRAQELSSNGTLEREYLDKIGLILMEK